ncbi:MAG: hypothetical protein IPN59_01820 [Holophaga sp.]|nr:hypothetical protein [Holophaga sp.]
MGPSEGLVRCETRIVNLDSAHDVRIREGRLALAWRVQVNRDGLELWDPVLASSFPLASEFVAHLLAAWGLPPSPSLGPLLSEEAFLDTLVARNPTLRAATLALRVRTFELDGVRVSHSTGKAGHLPIQSLHLTHEDPDLLFQILQKTGLSKYPNTNFPQGLKQALAL